MTLPTFDDLVAGMVALGTEPDQARKLAARKLGLDVRETRAPNTSADVARMVAPPLRSLVALPFRLTVPWTKLCSDNDKSRGYVVTTAKGPVPREKLTPEYKASKAWIADAARAVVGAAEPIPRDELLAIIVRVFVPHKKGSDQTNFSKVVHDALEGIVYVSDHQLPYALWKRPGIDVDAPRAEILVRRLLPNDLLD